MGGQPVVGLLPAFPNLIPQVLCVSYHARMWMSLVVDPNAIVQPQKLVDYYLDELKKLAEAAGVDPNDTSEPPPSRSTDGAAAAKSDRLRELV